MRQRASKTVATSPSPRASAGDRVAPPAAEAGWTRFVPFAALAFLLLFYFARLLESPTRMAAMRRRHLALAALVLQNCSVSHLTSYSLASTTYRPAVAILSTELVKAAISLLYLAKERRRTIRGKRTGLVGHAVAALADLGRTQKAQMLSLAVPAALYSIQNALLYIALSNLSAEIYQTTYQLKLLTTALFSSVFFKTRVTKPKWICLLLLTLGVTIVQLDSASSYFPGLAKNVPAATQDPVKGLAAILLACISSGLAGAWFEKVLKAESASTSSTKLQAKGKAVSTTWKPAPSLWARNLQLSVPSLVFALVGVYLSSSPTPSPFSSLSFADLLATLTTTQDLAGLWDGFTPVVWMVVMNQAIGGLLVALVVRETSSIDKGFATSVAIVLSTFFSSVISRTLPSFSFIVGAGLVIVSTCLYALAST